MNKKRKLRPVRGFIPLEKNSDVTSELEPRLSAQRSLAGFTIIELLIGVAILSLVGASLVFVIKNQALGNLESDSQIIASRLSAAQTRAITAVNGTSWGIHFDNITSTAPWYALFQGLSFVSGTETYYFTNSVEFQSPASGTSTDLRFNKLTGRTSSMVSIIIRLKSNTAETKTITVTPEGTISIP